MKKVTGSTYNKWGKGKKIALRFSKSGSPALESKYSQHYIAGTTKKKPDATNKSQ